MTTEHDTDNETPDDNDSALPPSNPASRSAFIERASKAAAAAPDEPDEPEEKPEKPAPAGDPPVDPEEARLAEITKRLEQRRLDAEARQVREEESAARRALLQGHRQPQQREADPYDDLDRDPIQALVKRGRDPKKLLEKLTQDALNPGSVRVEDQAAQAIEYARRLHQRIDSMDQQAEQRAAAEGIAEERRMFVAELSDAKKYPRAAKVPERMREEIGIREWEKFHEEERAAGRRALYDRELIAARTEKFLKDLDTSIRPASAEAPKTPKTPAEKAKASPKPSSKTLTPDMAAAHGDQRGPTPLHKRREAFVARASRGR